MSFWKVNLTEVPANTFKSTCLLTAAFRLVGQAAYEQARYYHYKSHFADDPLQVSLTDWCSRGKCSHKYSRWSSRWDSACQVLFLTLRGRQNSDHVIVMRFTIIKVNNVPRRLPKMTSVPAWQTYFYVFIYFILFLSAKHNWTDCISVTKQISHTLSRKEPNMEVCPQNVFSPEVC